MSVAARFNLISSDKPTILFYLLTPLFRLQLISGNRCNLWLMSVIVTLTPKFVMSVADEMLFLLAALQNRLFPSPFSTMKLEESHISVLAVHSVLSALKYWLLPWLFLLFFMLCLFATAFSLVVSSVTGSGRLLMQTDLQSPIPVPPS